MSNTPPPWPSPLDPVTAQLLQMYTTGQGAFGQMYAPYLDPAQQQQFYGTLPQTNEEGEPLSATQLGNLTQDYMDIGGDEWSAAMAGSQAYDVNAFQPTMSYNIIDDPAMREYNQILKDPYSFRGRIAEGLQRGISPETTIAMLRDSVAKAMEAEGVQNESEITDPSLAPIIASLDPRYDASGQTIIGVDWGSAHTIGREVATLKAQMQQAGPIGAAYDDDGNLVSGGGEAVWMNDAEGNPILVEQTSTPSPAAEWYTDQGLSLPTDEYLAEDFMGPEWHQAMANYVNYDPAIEQTFTSLQAIPEGQGGLVPEGPSGWDIAAKVYENMLNSGYNPEGAIPGARPQAGTLMPSPAEADVLNRDQRGRNVEESEGERVIEMPNLEVNPYDVMYGGEPHGMDEAPGRVPFNVAVPPGDIQGPGYDPNWVPPVDRSDEERERARGGRVEPGTVDELGGIYYGGEGSPYGEPGVPTSPGFLTLMRNFVNMGNGGGGAGGGGEGTPPAAPGSTLPEHIVNMLTPEAYERYLQATSPAPGQPAGPATAQGWPDYPPGTTMADLLQQQTGRDMNAELQASMERSQQGPSGPAPRQPGGPGYQQGPGYTQGRGEPARQPGGRGYQQDTSYTGEQRTPPLSEQLSRDERRSVLDIDSGVDDYIRSLHPGGSGMRNRLNKKQRDLVKARYAQNQQTMNADYGHALFQEAMMRQMGVRPLQQELAARMLPATAMGLPRGQLPVY